MALVQFLKIVISFRKYMIGWMTSSSRQLFFQILEQSSSKEGNLESRGDIE